MAPRAGVPPRTEPFPQLGSPGPELRVGGEVSVQPSLSVAATSGFADSFGPSVLVSLFAAVVFGWQVGRPGLWRDEAATIAAGHRSLGQLFDLSRNVDLVHLPYYLLAHVVGQFDGSVTSVRLISVLAMSLTAGGLVGIGRRLGSLRIGVLAGLLLAVDPFASRYAQEARPFALVTLAATGCTYALLRLCPPTGERAGGSMRAPAGGPAGGGLRGAQVIYAVSVALVGLLNVIALLLVVAQAGYVVLTAGPVVRRRCALPAVAGLVLISPFVIATFTQRAQVSWIEPPHAYDLRSLLTQEFGSRIAPVVIAAGVLLVLLIRRLAGVGTAWSGPAAAAVRLGLLWGVLPTGLLWLESQLLPLWDPHYLLFTLPGLCLLLAGLTRMPTGLVPLVDGPRRRLRMVVATVVPVLVLAGIGARDQRAERDPMTGHQENLRAVAAYLGAHAQPGDAIVFVPAELRILTEVYPGDFTGLDDAALQQTPLEAANLVGTPVPAAELAPRLSAHRRVWLVRGLFEPAVTPGDLDTPTLRLLAGRYRATGSRTITDVSLTRYDGM